MNWFDLISSVLGLTCVFLAGRGSKYNFWVGYLYTAALFLLFWKNRLFANLLLQPVSLCINIYGHYRWTHPKAEEATGKDGKELKVTMLTWPQRILAIFGILLIAGLWGWIINTFLSNDPVPYLDSCVTVLILTAQLLSAMKKWDCWVAWLLVNIAQLAMHLSVGNIFMPIVCVLYLGNAIWSLVSWTRKYKTEK